MRVLSSITSALCLLLLATLCTASAIPFERVYARDATPVLKARGGAPSPSPSPRSRRDREARVPTRRRHDARALEEEIVLSPTELSQHLCPQPMSVCPIANTTLPTTLNEWTVAGFECVDMQEDLTSCGGCGILDTKYDCTAIDGARSVSCIVGSCQVDSCRPGFTLALDGKSCLRTE